MERTIKYWKYIYEFNRLNKEQFGWQGYCSNFIGFRKVTRFIRPKITEDCVKYLQLGRIKATKAGKGWRVLKTELNRFLKGEKTS